eukprot:6718342-Prymnesium_polylepis.1
MCLDITIDGIGQYRQLEQCAELVETNLMELQGCGTHLRIERERAKLAADRAAARRSNGRRCAIDL